MQTIDDAIRRRTAKSYVNLDGSPMDDQPEWGGVQLDPEQYGDTGPAALTAGQMEQDVRAQGLINTRNEQRMGEIDRAEEDRGDPMARALEARKKDLTYERAQPVGATSSIEASYGEGAPPGLAGAEVGSDAVGEQGMGAPTVGEMQHFEQAILKQRAENAGRIDPNEIAQGDATSTRVAAVRNLFKLRRDLDADVAAGVRTPAEADAVYSTQEARIGKLVGMLKPGQDRLSPEELLVMQHGQRQPPATPTP